MESFKHDCEQTNWNCVYNEKDAQSAYTNFHKLLSKLYNKHFPLKRCKIGYLTKLPWLTDSIKKSIKRKNKMYIKSIKSKSSDDIAAYKTYRNCLNKIIRYAERQYYADLMNKNKSDIKSSWKTINKIINRKKHKVTNTIFYENTIKIDQPQIISQKFNNLFSNVGINLSKEIPRHDIRPTHFIRQRVYESFLYSLLNRLK